MLDDCQLILIIRGVPEGWGSSRRINAESPGPPDLFLSRLNATAADCPEILGRCWAFKAALSK